MGHPATPHIRPDGRPRTPNGHPADSGGVAVDVTGYLVLLAVADGCRHGATVHSRTCLLPLMRAHMMMAPIAAAITTSGPLPLLPAAIR